MKRKKISSIFALALAGMIALGASHIANTPDTVLAESILEDVPMPDPEVEREMMSEGLLENTLIEYAEDERVNIFADAGKLLPLPEEKQPETIAPLPEAESNAVDDSYLDKQSDDIRGAIVRVKTGYEFSDGTFDEWASGTGVMITKDCIMTDKTVAVVEQDSSLYRSILADRGNGYKHIGIDLTDFGSVKENIRTYVVSGAGNNECSVNADIFGDAFVTLTPATRVNAYSTAVFAVKDLEAGDKAGAVGTLVTDSTLPLRSEDIFIKSVTITGTRKSGSAVYTEFEGDFGSLNAGCPLIDSDKNVIGIITDGSAGRGTAVNLSTLQKALNDANLEYEQVSIENGMGDLRDLILKAEALNRSLYTETSLAALDYAMQEAQEVAASSDPSKNRINKAAENLKTAFDDLEAIDYDALNRQKWKHYGMIAACVLIVIIIVFVFFWFRIDQFDRMDLFDNIKNKFSPGNGKGKSPDGKKAKEEKKSAKKAEKKKKQTAQKEAKAAKQKEKSEQVQKKEVDDLSQTVVAEYDDEEGGTTILNSEEAVAYLKRVATDETIKLTKLHFYIGSSTNNDYRVKDGAHISRKHCVIRRRGSAYTVEDLNSTNGTTLHGEILEPGEQVAIKNGDEIILADEKFVFVIDEK